MQINASSSNSINFIEQKKLNTSSSSFKESNTLDRADSFTSETISSISLLESNESIGMLQIAGATISQLQDSSGELQKLIDKYSFFTSQEVELSEKFEDITGKMLDIVDNTMLKDSQLFYTTHVFSSGSAKFKLTMANDYGIEDLNIANVEELSSFDTKLSSVKTQIDEIKKQIEIVNFNQMAALQKNSPLLDIKQNITIDESSLSIEDIKRAHDTNSLKDKLSYLLED